MPRVSLGLPVYNGQNYVSDAICSARAQAYQDWELIISDNGSSDNTAAICKQHAEWDSRIRYYRSEINRGAAWNFNRVFELASGDYFRWLSHDDVLHPQLLERCVDVLDSHPQVILCATTTAAIDNQRRRIFDCGADETDLIFQGLNPEQEQRRIARSCSSQLATRFRGILLDSIRCYEIYGLIRREIMARTQLHPTYCGGEKVLLAELALLGPFHEIQEPLFFCRWHDERFTSIESAVEQNEHMQPGLKRRLALPHQYRASLGYLQLLAGPHLTAVERLACLAIWLRFVFQVRKWRQIVGNTFSGTAVTARLDHPTRRGPVVDIPAPLQPHQPWIHPASNCAP